MPNPESIITELNKAHNANGQPKKQSRIAQGVKTALREVKQHGVIGAILGLKYKTVTETETFTNTSASRELGRYPIIGTRTYKRRVRV